MSDARPAQLRVETPEQLRVIADPLRQRLLAAFAEPATVKTVAARLGEPVTKLYHHLAQLEAAGFLKVVGEQRRRGAVERTFVAAAHRFVVGAAALAGDGDDGPRGAGLAREALEDLLSRVPKGRTPPASLHLARTRLRITPEGVERLEAALGAFLKSFEDAAAPEAELLLVIAPEAARLKCSPSGGAVRAAD